MQIVINIPKYYYENNIKNDLPIYLPEDNVIAILPKGHGRLVDVEKLLNTFWTYCKQGDFGYHQAEDLIKSAPTIIEADKGGEQTNENKGNKGTCR